MSDAGKKARRARRAMEQKVASGDTRGALIDAWKIGRRTEAARLRARLSAPLNTSEETAEDTEHEESDRSRDDGRS